MSADTFALCCIVAAALPLNFFVVFYAIIGRHSWWRFPATRATMLATLSLAELVDISLLFMLFGADYPYRDVIRNFVYVQIALAAYLKAGALVYEWHRGRKLLTDEKRASTHLIE